LVMIEKRQQPRVAISLPVLWESATDKYQGCTSDISRGGCFIHTSGSAAVGEVLNFKLQLPTGELMDLRGEVRWQRAGFGFGVKFQGLSDESQKQVATLVGART